MTRAQGQMRRSCPTPDAGQQFYATETHCHETPMPRPSVPTAPTVIQRSAGIGVSPGPTPLESAIACLNTKIDEVLDRLPADNPERSTRANSVFLSCRFADIQYIDGLKALLADAGFGIITGDSADGYISQTILQRIRDAEYFVSLMTRHEQKADGTFTTSPWLLEEKGAALAFGKYLVLLIEEGVTDFGGLQGDWQRHHFAEKGFTAAALKAVKQLQAAASDSDLQRQTAPSPGTPARPERRPGRATPAPTRPHAAF
jgi:hypothetical protein